MTIALAAMSGLAACLFRQWWLARKEIANLKIRLAWAEQDRAAIKSQSVDGGLVVWSVLKGDR